MGLSVCLNNLLTRRGGLQICKSYPQFTFPSLFCVPAVSGRVLTFPLSSAPSLPAGRKLMPTQATDPMYVLDNRYYR